MKDGWVEVRLDDLVTVRSGSGFPKKYQGKVGEPIPFYKVSDMNTAGNDPAMVHENNSITESVRRELGASIFPAGSVIFPKIGGAIATNKKRVITKDSCVDNNVMGVVPKVEKIDSEFLLYFFLSHDLSEFANKAHLPSIRKKTVEGWVLRVPTALPEQRRIVGILDEAFDGIATAKANAEKNLQNARALFESHLNAVFTQRGKGWGEKVFSDVCEILSVLVDPRDDEYVDMPHVGGANIKSKTGDLIELKTAREEGLISGKFAFDETMVLYSKIRPYLMKVARPHFRGLCSADIYPLSVKPHQLQRDYLFHLLLSPEFTEYAKSGSARAGMPKVNRKHLFAFRVYLPPIKKQGQIAAMLDALHEETQRLESVYQRKLAALDELKKSLLHQAFTGKL